MSRKQGSRRLKLTVTLDVNTKLDVGQIKLAIGNLTDIVSVEADATPVVTTNTMDKSYIVDKTGDVRIAHERPELHLFDEHRAGHEQRRPKRLQRELQ